MKGSTKNTNNTKEIKGLCSGFSFIGNVVEKYYPNYSFDYMIDSSDIKGAIRNYLKFRRMDKQGTFDKYDMITLSTWENIIQYKKKSPDQLLIAYPNGFIVGLNYDQTIKEVPFIKRQLHKLLKFFCDKKMKQKYKEADLLVVSTPNMLEHAKKIRKDAIWLPNPIDTEVFNPRGSKVKLEGNPSVFLPTRLHAFKNPLFGVNLFNKIKEKYPDAKLHMIRYGGGEDPLFGAFKRIVNMKDVVYHDKMKREELSKYYRSADLILGQFNPNLAALGMVELEAMACGGAVISLDKYEIYTYPINTLERLALRIVEDKKFRDSYIKKNIAYIKKMHSPEGVSRLCIDFINKKNLLRKSKKS